MSLWFTSILTFPGTLVIVGKVDVGGWWMTLQRCEGVVHLYCVCWKIYQFQ